MRGSSSTWCSSFLSLLYTTLHIGTPSCSCPCCCCCFQMSLNLDEGSASIVAAAGAAASAAVEAVAAAAGTGSGGMPAAQGRVRGRRGRQGSFQAQVRCHRLCFYMMARGTCFSCWTNVAPLFVPLHLFPSTPFHPTQAARAMEEAVKSASRLAVAHALKLLDSSEGDAAAHVRCTHSLPILPHHLIISATHSSTLSFCALSCRGGGCLPLS